jgi:hypothetical protein
MRIDSVRLAYGCHANSAASTATGKTTGLAAWGDRLYDAIAGHFRIGRSGQIASDFADNPAMRRFLFDLFKASAALRSSASSV